VHIALAASKHGSSNVAALVQNAWEAVQAAPLLYRAAPDVPRQLSQAQYQAVLQSLNHWPSLSVDTLCTTLAAQGAAVGYVRDMVQHLLDSAPQPQSALQMTVLVVNPTSEEGEVEKLVLEALHGGQGDIFPHPWQMGSSLACAFRKAIRHAQSYIQSQGLWPPQVDVRWWLAQWRNHVRLRTLELAGDSLGGAFAAGLGCLFERRPVERLYAISAAVKPDGSFCGVGELPVKLEAALAAGLTQVIVARNQDFTGVDPERWGWDEPETGVIVLYRR